ncbi:uncharacterized protein LACBIDRAFT_331026 [Laccaria bicolor S238N-H82]|uniref:Predicted protein n=1 Tax=Laccaria bicolor (strain S238N-H82 / ATCC MYA-4686) TaxID=486041 RepID=B0DN72_LACBS|nr:uncharacterized protein LACBIDRAFT_331026 [Laccaria bicolor S238N-H82]EDR03822.1 predicted protein [Laccaria bicolor S238N-H82]|eukprot:XP_001885390.1 predicted protein [Laccaria bicolor S238N-H82]
MPSQRFRSIEIQKLTRLYILYNDVPAVRQHDHLPMSHPVRFIILTASKFGFGCPVGFFICHVSIYAYALPAHLCFPIPPTRAHSSASDFFVVILPVHLNFSACIATPRRPLWALVPLKP